MHMIFDLSLASRSVGAFDTAHVGAGLSLSLSSDRVEKRCMYGGLHSRIWSDPIPRRRVQVREVSEAWDLAYPETRARRYLKLLARACVGTCAHPEVVRTLAAVERRAGCPQILASPCSGSRKFSNH